MSNLSKDRQPRPFWYGMHSEELNRKRNILRKIFDANKIHIEDNIQVLSGPSISEFHITPVVGTKLKKIWDLEDEIVWFLGTNGVRTYSRPPKIIIEIPNDVRSIVPLKALLDSDTFKNSTANLPLALGYPATQEIKIIDLENAPHILVAGSTMQGKIPCLHSMAISLLASKRPDELKLVFIDPKGHQLREYREHLHVTQPHDALRVLEGLCMEMEERLENKSLKLPYIVCFVDEFGDLTVGFGKNKSMARQISNAIIRLAMKGHIVGIHMIISTQHPSTDVITGLIKANFPTRIAFRTFDKEDSKLIIDTPGAEKLLGQGDMLLCQGEGLERLQGGHVSSEEIIATIEDYRARHYKCF